MSTLRGGARVRSKDYVALKSNFEIKRANDNNKKNEMMMTKGKSIKMTMIKADTYLLLCIVAKRAYKGRHPHGKNYKFRHCQNYPPPPPNLGNFTDFVRPS